MKHGPLVDVVLSGSCRRPPCPSKRVKAMLDTGAEVSFVDRKLARKLRLPKTGRGHIHGITGEQQVAKHALHVAFPHDALLDIDLVDVVASQHLKRFGAKAILGRDAMAGGNDPDAAMRLSYDGASGDLELSPAAFNLLEAQQDTKLATVACVVLGVCVAAYAATR